MGNEFHAAKLDDELFHQSMIADFVNGVVKGAAYVGLFVAEGVLQKAYMLTPLGMGTAVNNLVSSAFNPAEPVENDPFPKYPSPERGFFEGFFHPQWRIKILMLNL